MSDRSRLFGAALWIAAVVFAAAAMVFQERTGPTKEQRGSFDVEGETYRFALTRSGSSAEDARVAIPDPGGVTGSLLYKRYKTDDQLTSVPLRAEDGELVGELPAQPAAGKLEYALTLRTSDGNRIAVPRSEETVVIRFKDPVPAYFLAPHITCMVLAILFGIRAGLSALVQPSTMVRYAWSSLAIITLGGMILGPIVQLYAFGALWTGFPLGYDLTDNKTLLMWLAWLLACATLLRRWHLGETAKRVALVSATVVMMAVYLIPHSAQGSELDYSQVDQGVAPEDAVTQGR
ncbi:MAG: hypothetical protein PVH40_01085 [Gemmatimonadales bacterium]|jgi:hypothetical protein